MSPSRFEAIVSRYPSLRIAVLGDFCLDRYLEIDPERREVSIETGLPVHNVVKVRPQPGGAGTVLNNLAALRMGIIYPIGFAGDDGEGYELVRALELTPNVRLDFFFKTPERRTFTYCKPLLVAPGQPPQELNRLDSKNWSPTPPAVQAQVSERLRQAAAVADAIVVLDQVDLPETGVVTRRVLEMLSEVAALWPDLPVLADSRRGLKEFPPLLFKMNASELAVLSGTSQAVDVDTAAAAASRLAQKNGRPVFVTLAEQGMVGAYPTGRVEAVPALPLRGEIDIVGAGDAVSANLAAALAAGASLRESLELANAAASVVIHKLGTTGTASPEEIRPLLA